MPRPIPAHLLAARLLPCALCGESAGPHHVLVEQEGGWVALCPDCTEQLGQHGGQDAAHGFHASTIAPAPARH